METGLLLEQHTQNTRPENRVGCFKTEFYHSPMAEVILLAAALATPKSHQRRRRRAARPARASRLSVAVAGSGMYSVVTMLMTGA